MAYPSSVAGFCAASALVVCGVADPTMAASAGLASTGFNATAWMLGSIGMLVTGFVLIRTAVFRRKLLPAAAPGGPETDRSSG